jgi:hypothetical protein
MTTLTEVQNFFTDLIKQLDPVHYPKSCKIISAFNQLPGDFSELSTEEIEQKQSVERRLYKIPSELESYDISSIEDRKHFVFEQIIAIHTAIAEEMPTMVRLLFKFTETVTIKQHSAMMEAAKKIWRFILAETIKYDIDHIEKSLKSELKIFSGKDQKEISELLKSFVGLQNQLKGLKLLLDQDFSRQDLLDICKKIKIIQNKLLHLTEKNTAIIPYEVSRNFAKWNDELNDSRMFIAKNLHLARKNTWSEIGKWDKFDRVLRISIVAIGTIALLTGFVALAVATAGIPIAAVVGIAGLVVVGCLAANAARGMVKWVAKKVNYGLPVTPAETNRAILKAVLSPVIVAAAIICHPIQITMQAVTFVKNFGKIAKFSQQNLAPALSKFAGNIATATKTKFTNLVDIVKKKLPFSANQIKPAPVKPQEKTKILQPPTIKIEEQQKVQNKPEVGENDIEFKL